MRKGQKHNRPTTPISLHEEQNKMDRYGVYIYGSKKVLAICGSWCIIELIKVKESQKG
jgi:hypothetical protein